VSPSGEALPLSYPDFSDLSSGIRSATLGYARGRALAFSEDRGPERLLTAAVSRGFLDVLGAPAWRGRFFTPEEQDRGDRVLVLSHSYSNARFGSDASVVGRTLSLDGEDFDIVGIAPPAVSFPVWAQAWAPIAAFDPSFLNLSDRSARVDAAAVARTGAGTSVEAVSSELLALTSGLAEANPETNRGFSAELRPLRDEVIGESGPRLTALGLAVAFLLLLASANVANLTLARALARSRVYSVHAALGAPPARVARQALAESTLVATAAGILGFVFATIMLHLVRGRSLINVPRLEEMEVDGRMALLAAAISGASMLLAAGLPVAMALRQGIANSLRVAKAAPPGSAARTLRSALVSTEIALSLVLLLGTGLLIRSLLQARGVDLGYHADRLITLRVFPPIPRYNEPQAALALYQQLEEAALAIPGVTSVGLINHMPSIGGNVSTVVEVPGRITQPSEELTAGYRVVSSAYVETAGLQILDGQPPVSGSPSSGVVPLMVNTRLASILWPADRAVGKILTVYRQSPDRPDRGAPISGEVVAMLGDVRAGGPESDPVPEVYIPIDVEVWGNVTLVVRTEGDPSDLAAPLRSAILEVDPDIPVAGIQTVSEALGRWFVGRTQVVALVGAFAAVAGLLAAAGLYAVLFLMVRERTREFGIRAALGANSRALTILVVRSGASLCAIGVTIGIVLGSLAWRAIRRELFNVSPADPVVLVVALAATFALVILATWLPASRASGTDVTTLLRDD
jgi:predicted permease